MKKLNCILGNHKLGHYRNVSDINGSTNNDYWTMSILKELYDAPSKNTLYMDASCVFCGVHIRIEYEVPGFVVGFFSEKSKFAVEYALNNAKSKKKRK